MEADMSENTVTDTTHDDDLEDEALDRMGGGKICAGGSLQTRCSVICV